MMRRYGLWFPLVSFAILAAPAWLGDGWGVWFGALVPMLMAFFSGFLVGRYRR